MGEEAGQRLKKIRERLKLRYRDVEEASAVIAQRHQCDEFSIALSRLADIENKGTVPSIYRLYSLCAIYRLDLQEVLEWYGVKTNELGADAVHIPLERTHVVGFGAGGSSEAYIPLTLDPGVDLRRTTFLSQVIARWGKVPLLLLNGIDPREHRYAFIGTEDWAMHPLLHPGALVMVDQARSKIQSQGWTTEFERPIYFLEHRDEGFLCRWCTQQDDTLILQPHPASELPPTVYRLRDVDIIGQVVGVAMQLAAPRRPRSRP